jgi:DNA damage-binding protein 1
MIGELSLPSAKILDDLQRNMDKYQKGPGGVSWRQFRRGGKPLVPRDTAGFIDGDLYVLTPFSMTRANGVSVQQFLKLDVGSGQLGEKVLKGGSLPEQVTKFGVGGKAESASRADVARVLEAAAGFH